MHGKERMRIPFHYPATASYAIEDFWHRLASSKNPFDTADWIDKPILDCN